MVELSETVLSIAETLYEMSKTKRVLLEQPAFQSRMRQVCEVEKDYLHLELDEGVRKVIETYMEEKDLAAEEKTFLAYMAGGIDMYHYLKQNEILRSDFLAPAANEPV